MSNIPKIRFRGFTEDWEQRKLETAFDFSVSNNTLSRAELNYEDGEVKSVHYGDVLIKYGSVLDAQVDEIPFITGKKGMDFSGQWLQEGDIIIADTAEDETTGKATEIRHLGAIPVVSGLHTIVCRPTAKMAPYYLGYYLNSDSYHRQLLPLMQGIKVLSLSRSNLIKTEIKYPKSQEEQKQIGCFFCSLDNLIALHQRKCDELSKLKKFMLKKMFPKANEQFPEIRFKGFTEAWEQRKVSELGEIYIGLVTTMTSHYTDHGTLLIRNSDIKDNRFEFENSRIYLDDEFSKQNASRRHRVGDVITVHTGDIGTSAVITEKEAGSIGFATIVTRPNKQKITSDFLCAYLNTDTHKNFALNISTGDGRNNYNLKDYYECVVPVPSIDEQIKISECIKNLNDLITFNQRQLRDLQNIKKYMLQNMFV